MKSSSSSESDKQDRKIIKLLEDLGSFKAAYPPELLTARRAAFLAHVERLAPAETREELPAGDQEIVKLLKPLRSAPGDYPPELLAARRVSFLAQVQQLSLVDTSAELSAADQEVVQLLGHLRSAPVEYPADLLAARRSAFLLQIKKAAAPSLWDRLRAALQRNFPSKTTSPASPQASFLRLSLVLASLFAAVLIGALFLREAEGSLETSPLQAAAAPTYAVSTSGEVAILICKPEDQSPSCSPEELDPGNDLADPGNGAAQPAVAKDARPSQGEVYKAAYVNDGRRGASWVSNSADSWIKIDLGQVRTINRVSMQKGILGSSYEENNPGQFEISVALSDNYANGDSSQDYVEYTQVFQSAQTGFSGTVSHAETIRTQFPPVRARFVKITFEKAGTAIEEVDVFMVEPPEVAEQLTSKPPVDAPESTLTPVPTTTRLAVDTATPLPSVTWVPTDTAVLTQTSTPTALPTQTLPPTISATPVLINPSPSDTPIPLPTFVPPTAIPATVQASPASTGSILVTGSNQTLTFTCNGDAAEIRGHANTVTLLGSCSSITVRGNGNRVYWESGSPVITNRGTDNIISQL